MNKQPEALRLADALDATDVWPSGSGRCKKAATELRRLHALNAELLEALKEAVDYLDCNSWVYRHGAAAIAKAEGKQ